MRKLLFFFASVAIVTSCGGNKSQEASNDAIEVNDEIENESVTGIDMVREEVDLEKPAEDDPEVEGWKVPFEFQTISTDAYNGTDMRFTTTYQLLKNGKLNVKYVSEYKDFYTHGKWEISKEENIVGKWSTTTISRGEGYQKVYVIDRADREYSQYLPDDLEYFWGRGSGYDWFECENYEIDKAMKVENARKL